MTDPRTRLLLVLAVGLLAVTVDSVPALALLALVSGLALAKTGLSRALWKGIATIALVIVWSTVLSQGLFYGDQPRVALLELGPLVVWREGVMWGLLQSLRMISLCLAGAALAMSTPPDRIFAALLRLRVPFGLAFLAVTALRFVPQVGRELLIVRRARARRGRPVHKRNPWAWLRLELMLLKPVVARSLRRARVLAESLDARGFDPSAPRAVRRPLTMARWEIALLCGVGLVVLATISARVLMLLYTSETLYFPELRELYGFVRDWL